MTVCGTLLIKYFISLDLIMPHLLPQMIEHVTQPIKLLSFPATGLLQREAPHRLPRILDAP